MTNVICTLPYSQPRIIWGVQASLRLQLAVLVAAYTAVDRAEGEPQVAYRINATVAGAVAQAQTRPTTFVTDSRAATARRIRRRAAEKPQKPRS